MSGKRFAIQDRVRWSDVDRAGIIYFGSYVRFFEIAETEMYRAMGLPYSEAFEVLDVYPVRAQFHIDFKSPAYLDDLLTVELWVSHIGTSSITLHFEIIRTLSEQGEIGQMLATGHCILVTVDHERYKPRRVPERLREAMQEFYLA
jgi:acyl-CoA thioester hydrolase